MSTDFNGRESDKPITDQDSGMFAAQPIWERNRKKKGFGARKTAAAPVSPEPRTFAAERDYDEPMALDTPVDTPVHTPADNPLDRPIASTATPSTLAAETETDAGLVAPIGTGRSTASAPKSKGVAPAAIAAGVVALGALGAAGWYMSRDSAGVPELTPGSTTSEVATAPLPPIAPPAQVAVNEAPPPPAAAPPAAEPPRASTPARSPTRTTARARPATAASSASSTGVNASTTAVLPDGPQPYSSVSPGTTAPTQVNPPLVTLPPTSEAPAQVPSTPPTLTPEPPPTSEAPKPETTVTPPQ